MRKMARVKNPPGVEGGAPGGFLTRARKILKPKLTAQGVCSYSSIIKAY